MHQSACNVPSTADEEKAGGSTWEGLAVSSRDPGRSTQPEAGGRRSPTVAAASFASTLHDSGAGSGHDARRGADCDAGAQRAGCAGAFGGNSAVSGSIALFLFNEAAEQVGGRSCAGLRRTGVRREVAGTMRA